MTVGYLPNSFDLLNVRDLDLISQARSLCSRLVVGVVSDEQAERLQGRRPVVPLQERMALVSYVRGVDAVVVHDEEFEGPPAGVTLFRVAGDPLLEEHQDGWVLSSDRESTSGTLREALSPVLRDDVA